MARQRWSVLKEEKKARGEPDSDDEDAVATVVVVLGDAARPPEAEDAEAVEDGDGAALHYRHLATNVVRSLRRVPQPLRRRPMDNQGRNKRQNPQHYLAPWFLPRPRRRRVHVRRPIRQQSSDHDRHQEQVELRY